MRDCGPRVCRVQWIPEMSAGMSSLAASRGCACGIRNGMGIGNKAVGCTRHGRHGPLHTVSRDASPICIRFCRAHLENPMLTYIETEMMRIRVHLTSMAHFRRFQTGVLACIPYCTIAAERALLSTSPRNPSCCCRDTNPNSLCFGDHISRLSMN